MPTNANASSTRSTLALISVLISLAACAGAVALDLLETVRKTKSDAAKSVKWPVDTLTAATPQDLTENDLASIANDLKGAGNIRELRWGAVTSIALSEQADAA